MYLFRKSKISTEKSIDGWKERIQGKNSTILFFGLWFFATAGLMVLVPLAEKRYAIVPLLPFFIVSFIIIGKGYKQYITKKRIILILFWILILSTLLVNVGMGLKYRYGFGNFVITTTEGWSFIENNYNDSYVVYLDTSTYFLPYGGKSNNTEIIYQEYNEIKNNLSADTQISFLGTKGPINEAEQDSTKLQETFVYGPYCSMVYEAGENNVQTVSLQEKGKTSLTYDFPKETTISYCSLLLETTFYLPKEVEITVVSEEGNITKKINPTVGRYQACEFACPTFENITIQGVEISWDSGFLREVNSGKIRFVEEE